MSSFKMIISIVPHDRGEALTRAAVQAGCTGGTVLMGRGLAKSNFGAILGAGETRKDIIYMVVENSTKDKIVGAIIDSCKNEKSGFGQLFTCDVNHLFKAGALSGGEDSMNTKKSGDMITVIVNKGYADDIMFAARKAGATGGTVINARGTAREDDEKFFGVHIVPEKDMLIIVVDSDKKDQVMKSISEVKCLKEAGMGIAFSSEVSDFCLLGKTK